MHIVTKHEKQNMLKVVYDMFHVLVLYTKAKANFSFNLT